MLSFITQFGGGKTHTLTALWHLAGSARKRKNYSVLAREHLRHPSRQAGVFVGNTWDPSGARQTPHAARSRLSAWRSAAGAAALGDAARSSTGPRDATSAPAIRRRRRPQVLVLMDEVLNFINRHRSMADPFYAFPGQPGAGRHRHHATSPSSACPRAPSK